MTKKVVVVFCAFFLLFAVNFVFSGGAQEETSAEAELVNITLAHHLPTSTMLHKAAEKFAGLVAEKTGGKVTVDISPGAQLGSNREILEQVKLGGVEMTLGESAIYVEYVPEFGLLSLPFVFEGLEHYHAAFKGEMGRILEDKLLAASGVRILAWMDAGIRDVYSNRMIQSVPEFDGLKIRTPTSPVFLDTFKALGANPTPIPSNEIYSSLQSGVVDAMEGTVEIGWTFKIFEVTKYCTETHHILIDESFAINDKFFSGLPKEYQEALVEAAQETAEWEMASWGDAVAEFKAKLINEGGITFLQIDLAACKEAVKPVYIKFRSSVPAADQLMAEIDKAKP